MKNDVANNIISSKYNKNNPNACSICKSEKMPIDFSRKNLYEINILKNKFKLKESDCSLFIKKCNCTKSSPKAHKICILLNVLYNFSFKCPECNSEYNIVIKQHKSTAKKCSKICSLINFLFLNIILYGASAFLIIYPIFIRKNENNDPEKNKFEHFFYFFGGLIFIINTFFMYLIISNVFCKDTTDINDYTIDIKDISESNKNKNNDKYYDLLYKFYRYFYQTQIRFLICKKHKLVYLSKGYGYFNKDLKELINKNHIECEKENTLNNGGDDILKINKKDKKNGIIDLPMNNIKDNEPSNGNIENMKRSSTLKEEGNKNKENENKENKNNTDYLPQSKNNNILINEEKKKKFKEDSDKKSIELISEKNNSLIRENENPKNKKIIIEVINTDIKDNENEKLTQKEEIKNKENNDILNMSKNSEKSKKSAKFSKNSKNKKNSKNSNPIKLDKKYQEESKNNNSFNKNVKNEDQKYIESTDLFKNEGLVEKIKMDEEDKMSKKELIAGEQAPAFDDNFNCFISSPFHNNGK